MRPHVEIVDERDLIWHVAEFQHAVGTALTLQTSLGFLLTAFTIWGAASLAAHFGWGVAFSSLALGPAFGIAAMRRLQLLRQRAQ